MKQIITAMREFQLLVALLLVGYFALKTKGPERLVLVSTALAVVTSLVAR